MKKLLCIAFVLILSMTLCIPAFAATTRDMTDEEIFGFADDLDFLGYEVNDGVCTATDVTSASLTLLPKIDNTKNFQFSAQVSIKDIAGEVDGGKGGKSARYSVKLRDPDATSDSYVSIGFDYVLKDGGPDAMNMQQSWYLESWNDLDGNGAWYDFSASDTDGVIIFKFSKNVGEKRLYYALETLGGAIIKQGIVENVAAFLKNGTLSSDAATKADDFFNAVSYVVEFWNMDSKVKAEISKVTLKEGSTPEIPFVLGENETLESLGYAVANNVYSNTKLDAADLKYTIDNAQGFATSLNLKLKQYGKSEGNTGRYTVRLNTEDSGFLNIHMNCGAPGDTGKQGVQLSIAYNGTGAWRDVASLDGGAWNDFFVEDNTLNITLSRKTGEAGIRVRVATLGGFKLWEGTVANEADHFRDGVLTGDEATKFEAFCSAAAYTAEIINEDDAWYVEVSAPKQYTVNLLTVEEEEKSNTGEGNGNASASGEGNSPATGDATPVAAIIAALTSAGVATLFCSKKRDAM